MDLVERYLAAIGRNLPPKQAGDITDELRDVLLNRVEEREEGLGRPLNGGEVEALLIDFGNPLVVAWRYRKIQQLIGPEVFPFWWAGLKISLAILVGVYVVLAVLALALGQTVEAFQHKVPDFGVAAVFVFGLATLIMVGFEQLGQTHVLTQWRPSRLPPAGTKPRPVFDAAVEGTASTVFILWWVGLFRFRDMLPIPDFISIKLAAVWTEFHTAILAYAVLDVAVAIVAIVRPGLVQLNATVSLARHAIGAGLMYAVLQAGHWVDVSGETLSVGALAALNHNFNLGVRVGLWATVAIMAIKAGQEAWRLYKARRLS